MQVGPWHQQPLPPRRRTSRRAWWIVLAAVVAVALAGGAVAAVEVVQRLRPAQLDTAWQVDSPSDDDKLAELVVTADRVTRIGAFGIRTYSLSSGRQARFIASPGSYTCEGGDSLIGGDLAVVVYRDDECDKAAAFDLTSGERVWDTEVAGGTLNVDDENVDVKVTRDLVFLLAGDRVRAVDGRTGETRWDAEVGHGCRDHTMNAERKTLLVTSVCDDGGRAVRRLTSVDTSTGRSRWTTTYGTTTGGKPDEVVGVDPPVVFAFGHDQEPPGFRVFTADGRSTRAVTATATDDRDAGEFVSEVEVRGRLAVGVTTGRDVVAFDIRTGERRWTRHYTGVDITFARGDDAGRLGIVATQYGDDEVPVVDTVGSGDGERRTSARLPVVAEGPFTYVRSGTTLIAAQATDYPDTAPWLAAYVPA